MHRVIQAAISEGATVFDFLRGEEPYKYRWAKTAVESVRLVYWKTLPAWVGANVHETLLQFRGAPAHSTNSDLS
jgi:CelD/BcsL family acetyltransferase involved in cellulose biosynthesis